nr:hypothetical protein [Tanacetum cinerariifolium]
MVACLKRTDRNAEFHQIVDFRTTSSIHYALTVSSTIDASYIEQFWTTAKFKTINDVKQIHATVDGKTVDISESSVRSDLYFNDEDGITYLSNDEIFVNLALMGYEKVSTKLTFQKAFFSPQWKYLIHTILHCLSSKTSAWNEFSTNLASSVICLAKGKKFNFSKLIFDGMLRNLDPTSKKILMYLRFLQLFLNNQIDLAEPFNDVYVTPAHTKKVFTNMKRQNKDFSGTITPLFASMLVPQVVEGEGSGQPSEPQPPSSTTPPSHEKQVTTVGNEAVYTGEDGRVVRAVTTATSLEAEQKSGNINKTRSTTTLNKSSPWGTSSGSGPRCQDTTLGDADAQTRFKTASKQSHDPPLSEVNTSRSGEDSMKHQDDLTDFCTEVSAACASITTAGVSISTVEPRTPPITITTIFKDEDWFVLSNSNYIREKPPRVVPPIEAALAKLILSRSKWLGKKQKSRRKQRKEIEVPSPSSEIPTEERLPTTSNDLLPSEAKITQAKEIVGLTKRVKKLEQKRNSRTSRLKRLRKVRIARRVESSTKASLGDQENASKQGRLIDNIDQDVEITLVDETQRMMNEEDMFGVNDLDGDEVVVDVSASKKVEQSVKVIEKKVSTVDPVITTGEVVRAK